MKRASALFFALLGMIAVYAISCKDKTPAPTEPPPEAPAGPVYYTNGDFVYTSDGTAATIVNYLGIETDLVIPSDLDELPVTGLGARAFTRNQWLKTISSAAAVRIEAGAYDHNVSRYYGPFLGCSNLESVSLPNATAIGAYAFYACVGLTNATFPNATTIGEFAFFDCSLLALLSIPEATEIGARAFYRCGALTNVSFPNALTISESAFVNCVALTNASIPNATSISDSAFYGCKALLNASFPNVTSLGVLAFRECIALTNAYFPVLPIIANNAFNQCSNLLNAAFPSATSVGNYAFYFCQALTNADFGMLTVIGTNALYENIALQTLTIRAASPPAVRVDGLYATPSTKKLYVISSALDAYAWWKAFYYFSDIIAIP